MARDGMEGTSRIGPGFKKGLASCNRSGMCVRGAAAGGGESSGQAD